MTPSERAVPTKLLAVRHRTTPQNNRFGLRKATNADFTWAVECAVVLAHPQPNRVLLADRSTTFLRAYA